MFFSSLTELTYTVANSPSYCTQIDFGFYNSTTGGVLVSPTNTDVTTVYPVVSSWAIKNNTLYALTNLNASDFASVTDGSQIVSYASSTNQTEITNLVNGIVIAFKTASGKMGLAKVISVYGSPTTFGAVDLAIKVEQ